MHWYYLALAFTGGTFLAQMVSGVQLIRTVINIRRYLSTGSQSSSLSWRTLVLHAFAFGLFLVSVILLAVASGYYWAFPASERAFHDYMIANIMWISSSFLSQCLLCGIFWNLSRPNPVVDKPFEMEVTEDSRVQARLWNSFMKNMHDREVDTAALMNYSVTPIEIMKVTLQIDEQKDTTQVGLN